MRGSTIPRGEVMHDQRFFANRRSGDDPAVLMLGGECDASALDELNAILRELLAEQPHDVIVDLARVTFVDSLTLGSLTAAAKRVRLGGGSFRVVRAVVPEVRRAFQVTGLDKYLLSAGPWRETSGCVSCSCP
jgi:anti-sigma B factor antagonist